MWIWRQIEIIHTAFIHPDLAETYMLHLNFSNAWLVVPVTYAFILFEETEEILECRLSKLYGLMFYQKKLHRFVQNVFMATYAYFHLFVNEISRTDTNSVRLPVIGSYCAYYNN